MLEVKVAKVVTMPLISALDALLVSPIADNATVVAAPLEIITPPLLVIKALKLNPIVIVIALQIIRSSALVTAMLEVKPEKVETSLLIVAFDVSLVKRVADNADVVAAPPEIVKPPLLVTNAFEFNPVIFV